MRFAPLSPVIPQLVYMRVYFYRYIYGPCGKSGAVSQKRGSKNLQQPRFSFFSHVDLIFSFLFAPLRKKKKTPAG